MLHLHWPWHKPEPEPFTIKTVFSRKYLPSLGQAFLMLGLAFVCEHFANVYAFDYVARPTSKAVGDLILDNLPLINVNFIIIEMALATILVGGLFIIFFRSRYLLFSLKAFALFIIVRAFFMSLTHVGIYPAHIDPGVGIFDSIYLYFNFETGLFFSGHTGMPFLMGLIFWDRKIMRYIFFGISFIFAAAVLFAHIHYSIDVFAAPFMAYGIFKIAQFLFPHDYALATEGKQKPTFP